MNLSYPAPNKIRNKLEITSIVAELFTEKSFLEAEPYIKRGLELDPKNTEFMSLYAHFFAEMKDFQQALNWYKKAISINQKNNDLWRNLGDTYLLVANYEEANKAFSQAIKIKRYDFESWKRLGVMNFDSNKFKDAQKCYEEAYKIKNNDPEAILFLSTIANTLKEQDKASKYNNELQILPNMVEELTNMLKKLQSLFPQNVFILKTLIEYMTETSLSAEIIIYHRKLDELMKKK